MRFPLFLVFVAAACASAAPSEDPLAALSRPGADHALDRLVAARQAAGLHDPLAARVLAAAYARLEADPGSGFGPAEKAAILQALAHFRDPIGAPCACKALGDPDRPVRQAALQVLGELRHAQAAPGLIDLMASAGEDRAHGPEDFAIAQRASDLLEVLANGSMHFEALTTQPERKIAVARWRQWWEANRGQPRTAWQRKGFQDAGIQVSLPLEASGVPALLEALSPAQPSWIRENAFELLAGLPSPPAGAKMDQPACAALAKGLDHADENVRRRTAVALYRVLSRGMHADLPEAPLPIQDPGALAPKDRPDPFQDWEKALPVRMKTWWASHSA